MKIWLDAQLPPSVAAWLEESEGVAEAFAIQLDPTLRSARDAEVFSKAGEAGAVVMAKDRDFVDLLERRGPPPPRLWRSVPSGPERTDESGGNAAVDRSVTKSAGSSGPVRKP